MLVPSPLLANKKKELKKRRIEAKAYSCRFPTAAQNTKYSDDLVVSFSSYKTASAGSILGVTTFPGQSRSQIVL